MIVVRQWEESALGSPLRVGRLRYRVLPKLRAP